MIPIAEGRRLYEAARGEKTFVEVRGGHVDATTVDTKRFYGAIRTFLAGHHLISTDTLDSATPPGGRPGTSESSGLPR